MKPIKSYKLKNCPYRIVFESDIAAFHGAEFMKKFYKESEGSTCPYITERPKGYVGDLMACYIHDYERFRDLILNGRATYFD